MDYLRVAMRALIARTGRAQREPHEHADRDPRWPRYALIFDTETTTDATQALLFGSYRRCREIDGKFTCVEEGLFYGDDLPDRSPDGYRLIRAYAQQHRAEHLAPWADRRLRFMSRREFVDKVFWPRAYNDRGIVVGFNLPFDLSRVAVAWGEGRSKYRGGFSLTLWDYRDKRTGKLRPSGYRPRIRIKHIDNKRSFIAFGPLARTEGKNWTNAEGRAFEGRFLDLKTFAFALTNNSYSLASACRAFGVVHGKQTVEEYGRITGDFIDYSRRDVLATQELLEKLRQEFDRHPIDLDPCRAFSPASIAKAYFRTMGIKPSRELFQ